MSVIVIITTALPLVTALGVLWFTVKNICQLTPITSSTFPSNTPDRITKDDSEVCEHTRLRRAQVDPVLAETKCQNRNLETERETGETPLTVRERLDLILAEFPRAEREEALEAGEPVPDTWEETVRNVASGRAEFPRAEREEALEASEPVPDTWEETVRNVAPSGLYDFLRLAA